MTVPTAAAILRYAWLRRLAPPLCISIVLIGWSLAGTSVPGVNEPHYLCKARHWFNPAWCGGDFFLESSNAHYVFYLVTGPLTEWLSFEAVAILGRAVSLTLMGCSWWLLSRRLGLSAVSATAAAATFGCIALAGNFSGEWIVGGFEGKVPAYGFCLLGTALWLHAHGTPAGRHWIVTGLALGAAVAFHPVVGLWYCIGIGLTEFITYVIRTMRQRTSRDVSGVATTDGTSWSEFAKQQACLTLSAIIASLPGLIPAISLVINSSASERDQRRALYFQVFRRLAHHLDPSRFPERNWIHTAVVATLTGGILWYVWRRSRRHTNTGSPPEQSAMAVGPAWRLLGILLLVATTIGIIGVKIGWHDGRASRLPDWHLRASILRYYPFRFVDGLLPVVGGLAAGLLLTTLTSGRRRYEWGITAVLCAVLMIAAWSTKREAPSGYTAARFQTWKEACEWIRLNTAQESVILGPREGFGLKWYAERPEYVCYKDCPQDAEGIVEWDRRLRLTGKWKWTRRVNSQYGDGGPIRRTDVVELHRRTGATHILTRRLRDFEQAPVYRNQYWRVYDIRETEQELRTRKAAEAAD